MRQYTHTHIYMYSVFIVYFRCIGNFEQLAGEKRNTKSRTVLAHAAFGRRHITTSTVCVCMCIYRYIKMYMYVRGVYRVIDSKAVNTAKRSVAITHRTYIVVHVHK